MFRFMKRDNPETHCVTHTPKKKVDIIYTDLNGVSASIYEIGPGSLSPYR